MFVNMVCLKIPPYCNFFLHVVFLFIRKYALVDEFCTSFTHPMRKVPKILVVKSQSARIKDQNEGNTK